MKKINLISIFVLAMLFSLQFAIAQPQISSTSGTFNDGSTITISGNNFGTKANPRPYLWADFDSGSINPSPLGQMTSWNSIGGMSWISNEGYGNTGGVKATDSSGSWAMSTVSNGFAWNDLNQKMYIFRKTKHNFIVDFNWKIWRMWPQTDIYPNVHIGRDALNVENIDCPNGASNLGYFNLPSQQEAPANQWKTEELRYKVNSQLTSSDGEFYFDVNGRNYLTLPYYDYAQKSFCLKTSTSQQMVVNYVIHGVKANTVFPTDYRMWNDDVYLDTTWSRVMLSASPTWTGIGNKEIQIPTSWSSNSISIVLNTGAFSTGQTAYLYVVNSSNGANSQGYPIIIGQTGTPPPADTTAPTLSNPSPSGTLAAGTTSTTISITTNEAATCRYSTTTGINYASMTNSFTTTNGLTHTHLISGLVNGQTYNYQVRCSDSSNNVNTNDYTITFNVAIPTADTTPPSQVNGLTATATSTSQINLAWNSATDNVGISSYIIYRNNIQVGTSATTTYSDTGLTPSTAYSYKISAVDNSGNKGANSTTTSVTTIAISDSIAPSQVNGLTATATSTSQINLAWTSASDNVAVTGYRIYRNNIQVGTSATTTYSDTGLNENTTYQYKVSAYDAAGNSGLNSTINSATTQAATLPNQNTTNISKIILAKYAFEDGSIQQTNQIDNQIATLTNGPISTFGKYGQGIQFDGIDDYIQLPQSYAAGKQEFTMMFWINPAKWDYADTIYDEWTNDVYWQYTISPGAWVTRDTSTTTTGTRNNDLALPNLQTGTWHHLALTYSDSNNIKRIYLNGNQISSTTNSIDQLTSTRDTNARIGFASDGTFYQGLIDEVKIFSYELNQQEIISEMNTPIVNVSQPTVLEGDVNSDGNVNLLDINSVVLHFGKTSGYPNGINLASGATIDLFDIMIIIRNWGRTR